MRNDAEERGVEGIHAARPEQNIRLPYRNYAEAKRREPGEATKQ